MTAPEPPTVAVLAPGGPRHAALIAAMSREPLRSEWYNDAESEAEPDLTYAVTYAWHLGRPAPAAWAGWRIAGGVFYARNNYERRGYRDRRLYALAYRTRHEHLIRSGLPGETYLYPEPIPLHEADGWERDLAPGASGVSTVTGHEHHWQRLTFTPGRHQGAPRAVAPSGAVTLPAAGE